MIVAHDHKTAAEEKHAGDAGDFIKSLVFGGLDGIITTFAIVSAAIGASLPNKTVIIMGLANLMVRKQQKGGVRVHAEAQEPLWVVWVIKTGYQVQSNGFAC